MNQIYIFIFVVIFVLVVVALLSINARWQQKWHLQLSDISIQHGWKYQRDASFRRNCVITGYQGDVPWTLTYVRLPTNSTKNTQYIDTAEWHSPYAKLSSGTVLVIPRLAHLPANINLDSGGMGGMMLQFLLQKIGIDSAGLSLQTVGSPQFQTKYMVLSQTMENARTMVTNSVENPLLNWPYVRDILQMPSITVETKGVTVRARRSVVLSEMFGQKRLDYERELPELLLSLGITVVAAVQSLS